MRVSREEFCRLALEQIDVLSRMAMSLTRKTSEADDLVQETYLRALKSWESFDLRECGIRPWLLRILHNTFNTRATRQRRQAIAVDPEDSVLQNIPASEDAFPVIPVEMDGNLRRAVDELPVELRSTMLLWAVEELSYKEIAVVAEIPIGTVMSRLFRAKRMLAKRLAELSPEWKAAATQRLGQSRKQSE